jgi:hypothetical protein
MALGNDILLQGQKEAENYLGETVTIGGRRVTALVSEILGGVHLEVGGAVVMADGNISVRQAALSSVPTNGTVVTARNKACRVVSIESDANGYRLLISGLYDRR